MDEADRAAKYERQMTRAAIAHRKPVPRITPNYLCHNCEAPVGPKQLFCDSDCGEEWEQWITKERSR